jgi:FkbM family methyltransferase
LLFKNCAKIKSLFADVTTHIAERVPGDYDLDGSFDQDFIIYQCYIQDCYENSHLTKFIKYCAFDADSDMILNHFCSHYSSNCGMPDGKLDQMKVYLSRIGLKQHAKNIIHVGANIGDCYHESEALSLFNNVSVNDNCIFIEPVPYLFKQLKENYNNKYSDNNFTFINKAVSDTTGKAEMTIASEDNDFTNLDKWSFAFIGSLDPQHMPKHVEKTGVELELDTITVPTITLNDLVKESGMTIVDILIIDAEGYDYRILMDYDFIIKPKKLIFEHCYMTEGSLAILLFNLQLMGYKQIGYTQLDMVFELS